MLLAWLLPQAGSPALTDGWARTAYQPRHVRPPLIVRVGHLLTSAWSATVGNVSLDYEMRGSAGER